MATPTNKSDPPLVYNFVGETYRYFDIYGQIQAFDFALKSSPQSQPSITDLIAKANTSAPSVEPELKDLFK